MKGPRLGPGMENIIWPDQVAPRGRRTPSTRKVKRQTLKLLRLELMYWYFTIVSLHETIFFEDIPLNNAFEFALYGLYHMHGRKPYIIYNQVPQMHTWVILAPTTLRNRCCCHQHCE